MPLEHGVGAQVEHGAVLAAGSGRLIGAVGTILPQCSKDKIM